MKKIMLLFICFMLAFTAGFVSAKTPLNVRSEGKVFENSLEEYIIKDNKVYVSEDALKRDFGFNVAFDKKENSVQLYNTEKNKLEESLMLFQEFMEEYNPQKPEEVAQLWAKGVKTRNGSVQYAALNKQLKENFKEVMDKRGSWVTGFSSPWIESYNITKEKVDELTWKYNISFKAVTSASDTYIWHATLVIGKENGKWRITDIQKDFDI